MAKKYDTEFQRLFVATSFGITLNYLVPNVQTEYRGVLISKLYYIHETNLISASNFFLLPVTQEAANLKLFCASLTVLRS